MAVTVLLAVVAGCTTMGTKTATTEAFVCPKCHMAADTMKAGDAADTHLCPSCGRQYVVGEQGYFTKEVHVCGNCGAVVEKCPVCRAKTQSM